MEQSLRIWQSLSLSRNSPHFIAFTYHSPPPVTILSQTNPAHDVRHCFPNTLFKIFRLISSLQVSQTKFCKHLSSPPCVLYVQPTSLSLVLLIFGYEHKL